LTSADGPENASSGDRAVMRRWVKLYPQLSLPIRSSGQRSIWLKAIATPIF